MSLKEHRLIEVGDEGSDGGIKALEVAYLKNQLTGVREGDERICLVQGGSDGFFDQDMKASVKSGRADSGVRAGRRADGRSI
jgi:hypothetical protein